MPGYPQNTSVEVWDRTDQVWKAGEVYSDGAFVYGGQWCYKVTTRQVLVLNSEGQEVWQGASEVETRTFFAKDTKKSDQGPVAGFT